MPVSAGFPLPVPSANFMAIYFCCLCEEKPRDTKGMRGLKGGGRERQLYSPGHHQSFCLKEYIAIKTRKYAVTLANRAISLPLVQQQSLLWFRPSLFMKRNTFGATHCILTAKLGWASGGNRPSLPAHLHLVATVSAGPLMFYYPAKSSKLKLLHSGPPSTL